MKILRWFFVILCIFGLISIRMWEDQVFYDPFLQYFHKADKHAVFPEFGWIKLIFNYIFRFVLNLFFSAAMVYFIFKNRAWMLQAVILMVLVFAITFPIYLYCIYAKFEIGYLFSFYMRRFVIQPLILLLIIPLFYYREKVMTNRRSS